MLTRHQTLGTRGPEKWIKPQPSLRLLNGVFLCVCACVCVCVRCREGFISPSSDQPSVVSLGFHQQTFVSVRSSDEPLASVHVSLSLSPCLPGSLSQPATGMHVEERLARPTGSNKFKAALEPGCLSLSPGVSLSSPSPTPPAPVPCFPSLPPPLQLSLFSSLLCLQTLLLLFFSSSTPPSPFLSSSSSIPLARERHKEIF